ncbi:MAG: SRPBCC family protein [Gaiellaceae bacterium]
MSAQAQDLTVRKSVTVNCPPEQAFELFTDGLDTWWPFESHSVTDERPEKVVFEGREGGRVYDRLGSGEEHDWATVSAWEPPKRLVIDWRVNPKNPSTELEVRFTAAGDGTRVELEHRGWERYGEQAGASYDSYNGGWDTVLGRYVEAGSR